MKKRMLKQIGVIAMSAVLAMPTTSVYAQQLSCDALDVQQEDVTGEKNSAAEIIPLTYGVLYTGGMEPNEDEIYSGIFVYYEINVPYSGKISVTCMDDENNLFQRLYNADFKELENGSRAETYKVKPGTYYIGLESYNRNIIENYKIRVTYHVPATDVELSENRKSLKVGEECSLDATVSPDYDETDKRVKWSVSGNKKAVVVDQNGNMKAKQPGIAKVCAQTVDGSKKKAYATIVVKPKKTTNLSVEKQGNGSVKTAWAVQSGVTGYQIQYAENAKFSKASTKYVSKNKDTKKLSRKTYYVRVRAYVFDSMANKKYYGAWSSVKKVNVK